MKLKTIILVAITVISAPSFANHGAPAPAPKPLAIACPSTDFKKFIYAFADSVEVQKAFTKIPGVDNEETTFPMIPSASKREEERMGLHLENVTKNSAKVVLDKDQTDYKVAFYFEKKACWTLVKVEDLSG